MACRFLVRNVRDGRREFDKFWHLRIASAWTTGKWKAQACPPKVLAQLEMREPRPSVVSVHWSHESRQHAFRPITPGKRALRGLCKPLAEQSCAFALGYATMRLRLSLMQWSWVRLRSETL